jgi:hypothetical protein
MNSLDRSLRRRIVKGSLAAPVVLTVSSASATPLTSFGRCLRNDHLGRQPAFFAESAKADTWFRKPVDVVRLSHRGSARGVFFLDPKLGYVNVRDMSRAGFGTRLPEGWMREPAGKRWALVFVDKQNGREYRDITLQRPAGYSATTVSCYTSLRA